MSLGKSRLDASVTALRELTAEAADGRASRARVLGQLVGRAGRRGKLGVVALCSTLLLVVPVASAGLYHGIASLIRETPTPAQPRQVRSPRSAVDLPSGAPPTAHAMDLVPDTSPAETVDRDAAEGGVPTSSRLAPTRPLGSSTAAELAMYERAHRAHFREASPRAALRRWNDYLARFPHGRFRPEAELNRAVCLVQLGDRDRAREALLRLTTVGGADYPKDQAERLLAKLRGSASVAGANRGQE